MHPNIAPIPEYDSGVRAAPLPGQYAPGLAVGCVHGGDGRNNALVRDYLRLGITCARAKNPGRVL